MEYNLNLGYWLAGVVAFLVFFVIILDEIQRFRAKRKLIKRVLARSSRKRMQLKPDGREK